MACDLDRARAQVRVLIPTGLGLNCEAETAQAFRMCGAEPQLVHLSDLLEGPGALRLSDYHVLAMAGGFAFGDHLGAGVVYANRLRYRAYEQLQAFVEQGGLVLGICNGMQTMTRLGLLPGFDGDYRTQLVTLAANERVGYRDAWVRLGAEPQSRCLWTKGIDAIELPARHGEGRLLARSDEVLQRIEREGLVALRYIDERGARTQRWPANPNGSVHAIAGMCDPSGRLFGLMPHPDAFLYGIHHPQWPLRKLRGQLEQEGDGLRIFRNGVDHVARRIASAA